MNQLSYLKEKIELNLAKLNIPLYRNSLAASKQNNYNKYQEYQQ